MLMSSSPSPSPSFHPPHPAPHHHHLSRCSPSLSASGYRSPQSSSSSSSNARRIAASPKSFARSSTHGLPLQSANPARSPRALAATTPSAAAHRQPSGRTSSSSASSSSPGASRTGAYVDVGTQYSPVDWPPTSSRATVSISKLKLQSEPAASPAATTAITTAAGAAAAASTATPQPSRVSQPSQPGYAEPASSAAAAAAAAPKAIVSEPQPPSEPRVRVTPQSALNNVSSASSTLRRERSSTSDATSADGELSDSAPSAAKRARSDGPGITLLPMDYVNCDTKYLTILISDMLLELIRYNDEIPLADGQLTRFHSRAAPSISVRDYLHRLTFHATLSPPILLSMVCLIDKLCTDFPAFTINSLTVHRFLITAATVASKGLSDSFWTNNTYARVGGVTMKELAMLEIELLSKVGWRIVPTPEKLEEYYRNLIERHTDYELEAAPASPTKSDNAMDTTDEAVAEGTTIKETSKSNSASATATPKIVEN